MPRRLRRIRSLLLLLGAGAGLSLPWPAAEAAGVVLQPIATGLRNPVAITHAGDGSGRLFITQQTGQVLIHDGSQLLPAPFLDIASRVSCCGEEGLLSVAFHPSYASNGFFFVYHTNPRGDLVIARYRVSASSNVADPGSRLRVLGIPHPGASNHNGGQLQFGPDGYLYAGIGDGGGGGDPNNNAQSRASLLGKLLRLDVDSASPYAIPLDNPFMGTPGARGEIWALGLRNPWRFGFDRLTGDLFIADVGQNMWEEVDFQPAGSPGGQNYGWRVMEGAHCFDPPAGCNPSGLTPPILEYDHSQGCSIIGGYRYRGTKVPQLAGRYIYGDLCSGLIWAATPDGGGGWTTSVLLEPGFTITTFGEDEAGELYVADYAGVIYRIVDALRPPRNLSAVAVSSGRVNLHWRDRSSAESGFRIQRAVAGGGPWTLIATVGADVTGYSDSSLSPGTTYYYRVRAFDAAGGSNFSNVASATPRVSAASPSAPTGLSATSAGSGQIDLAWTDTATDESGFKIFRATAPGGSWTRIATVGADLTTYSDRGRPPGTTVYYRVRAYNPTGNSAFSDVASATP